MSENILQHGMDWNGQDVTGYLISEKLDGCRIFWDGQHLRSRGGLVIPLPPGWSLPSGFALDGELYAGIGGLSRCSVAVRYGRISNAMHFHIFDAPNAAGSWTERMEAAARAVEGNIHASCVSHRVCLGVADAMDEMRCIQARGGEGIMLRHPRIGYTPGRSSFLLKMKYLAMEAA